METNLFPDAPLSPLCQEEKRKAIPSTTTSKTRSKDFPRKFKAKPSDREKRLIVRRLWIKLTLVAPQQLEKQTGILWH
jgi:hypothetical protein